MQLANIKRFLHIAVLLPLTKKKKKNIEKESRINELQLTTRKKKLLETEVGKPFHILDCKAFFNVVTSPAVATLGELTRDM